MVKKFRDIIYWLFDEVWSRGEYEHVHEFIAPQLAFHFRGQTFTQSPQDLIQIVERWREAFPDLRFEIGTILIEGDLAAVRLTRTGTHRGAWRGIRPTGRRIQVEEMMFLRFEAGQIIEVWEVTDEYSERQQLTESNELV